MSGATASGPRVGDALAPFGLVVDPAAMRVWADALRDPNPIHLDADAVRAQGLGDRVINQGPANAAYLINLLQRAFPDGVIEALEFRFLDNVYGGEAVEATGTVVAVADDPARVTCELLLSATDRRQVVSGQATVRL